MSSLRNEPVQSRSRQTLDRILEAAERVLEDVGPDGATSRLIAERAGVSVGSLYRFFPDKAAIIRELVNRYVAQMGTPQIDALAGLDEVTIDQVDGLVEIMVLRSLSLHEAHPAWRKTRHWQYPDTDELANEPIRTADIAIMSSMFQLAANVEPAKADLVATTVSLTLWPLLERALTEPENRDELTQEAIHLTSAYLKARFAAEFAAKAALTES